MGKETTPLRYGCWEHNPQLVALIIVNSHVDSPVSSSARRVRAGRIAFGAALTVSGLLLAGCTQQMLGGDQDQPEQQPDQPLAGDVSTPDPSPKAAKDLPGDTGNTKLREIRDVVSVGLGKNDGAMAVLTPGTLSFGTAEEALSGEAKTVEVDESCDNLNTSAEGVAVACQGSLLEFDVKGNQTHSVDIDGKVTSGTFTDSGKAVAGKEDSDRIFFYSPEGEETDSQVVSPDTDESLLMNTGDDRAQRVAVIDRSQTRINDISVEDQAVNAALRIGQGVGEVAVSDANDGVIVASDHRKTRVQIFTMLDVVRLHQEAPTGPSPWAVNWDDERQLAWVSTTGDNKLTAYSISTGTPLPVAQMDTIANVRNIIPAADGELLLVSEDGQWQKISSADIDSAKDKGVHTEEDFGEKYLGGQE